MIGFPVPIPRKHISSGEPVKHGEDRVCSTAMAINTLLYTWMDGEVFISSVPEAVKEVVRNASLWLARNIKKMKPYNVVFSGSVKLVEVGMANHNY